MLVLISTAVLVPVIVGAAVSAEVDVGILRTSWFLLCDGPECGVEEGWDFVSNQQTISSHVCM
jgi:hypothetical protein